jgi:hypothetical protein
MSSGNGHKTETPDVSHIRNVEVTHETSDVSVRGVMTFVVVLTVSTAVISLGLWFLFKYFNQQEAQQQKPGPMALTQQERLPPEPRLQGAPGFGVSTQTGQQMSLELSPPQAEYRMLREQWDAVLRGGLKDQSGNTVGIPIDQAIEKVVSGEGLPARTKQAPEKLEDYAISMPTDTSSGRESVKKLQ